MFGGHAANSYLNDLHKLDLGILLPPPPNTTNTNLSPDTYVWEKIEPQGTPPSPRWQHSMVLWRGLLMVFGGCDSTSYLNDLHSFDIGIY